MIWGIVDWHKEWSLVEAWISSFDLWALHASNTSVPEYKKKKLKFN